MTAATCSASCVTDEDAVPHGIRTREESPRSRHARRLAAGVLALVVASFLGEPSVDSSVGSEEAHAALPGDLPATLLWRLRLSAGAIHATLWGAFALVFGELAQRALEPPLRPESAPGDGFQRRLTHHRW
ncbi:MULTISPECIES: hypothetical protein [unclassified Streptomyces]|uniref:hypothetical protein n=1 Tax=unclassified Streptomyces TaxID=2593676 RepID=UPI00365311AC